MESEDVTMPIQLEALEINRICSDLQIILDNVRGESYKHNPDVNDRRSEIADTVLLTNAKNLIRERNKRQVYFSNISFSEPSWDIMLDLFVARLSGCSISISSACIASRVPPTTALRYISRLDKDGLVHRVADVFDSRRVYLELSRNAMNAMRSYLRTEVCGRESL